MLAPINSPREILASAQLAAREFFGPLGDVEQFPRRFVVVRSRRRRGRARAPGGTRARARRRDGASRRRARDRRGLGAATAGAGRRGTASTSSSSARARPGRSRRATSSSTARPSCGSSRKSRPDFLRVYALGPKNPHGLEGAPMFDGLNVGKRNVTFNLKHPKAVELVRRLVVEWADAVAENFAPRAMRGFGLDYDTLVARQARPRDGQRVPQRPDRTAQGLPRLRRPGLRARRATTSSPAGPTASRSGRTARSPTRSRRASSRPRSPPGCSTGAAPAAACYLDVSPGRGRDLLALAVAARLPARRRDRRARRATGRPAPCPHGAFPCADEGDVGDRWVAIAAWTDDEWTRSRRSSARRSAWRRSTPAAHRRGRGRGRAWTHARVEVAETLQAAGIEAVPVQDFGDVHDDPQLAHREHFVAAHPPVPRRRPLRAQRLPALRRAERLRPGRPDARPGPGLGARHLLGLSPAEQDRLREAGALD